MPCTRFKVGLDYLGNPLEELSDDVRFNPFKKYDSMETRKIIERHY